jgi:hypothetical protein
MDYAEPAGGKSGESNRHRAIADDDTETGERAGNGAGSRGGVRLLAIFSPPLSECARSESVYESTGWPLRRLLPSTLVVAGIVLAHSSQPIDECLPGIFY